MLKIGTQVKIRLIIRGQETEWRRAKIVTLKKPTTPDGTEVMELEMPSGKIVKFSDDVPKYHGPFIWKKANTQQLYDIREVV